MTFEIWSLACSRRILAPDRLSSKCRSTSISPILAQPILLPTCGLLSARLESGSLEVVTESLYSCNMAPKARLTLHRIRMSGTSAPQKCSTRKSGRNSVPRMSSMRTAHQSVLMRPPLVLIASKIKLPDDDLHLKLWVACLLLLWRRFSTLTLSQIMKTTAGLTMEGA